MKLTVKKSKRLEAMMTNETWLMRLYREFAIWFLKAWKKESGSEREWVKGIGIRRFGLSRLTLKPHPTKLTVRSGRLLASALGKSEHQENITVNARGFKVTRTLSVPYANRQERQLSGKRAYIFPSGQYVKDQLGEKILEQSLKEVLK